MPASLPRHSFLMPSGPLHERVPTRDSDGKTLTDFMMLFPKLREQPQILQDQKLATLDQILTRYQYLVVYADMNLKLNLLWISMRPIHGGMGQLVDEIQAQLPEALVVGHRINPDPDTWYRRSFKKLALLVPRPSLSHKSSK